jgi:hypothetical protein
LTSVASTLSAALLAVAAFAGERPADLPHASRVLVLVAVSAFVAAVLVSLAVLVPSGHDVVPTRELERIIDEDWGQHSEDTARQQVARVHVDVLESHRKRNRVKAWCLLLVVVCEACALVALAVAIAAALF